jgi:ATP-dependent Clp protease ATP-binding subunit ClpA
MFERFTERAIKVIMLAQQESRRLGHNFVGTEQILLGLIGEGRGIAAESLKVVGVNLKNARVEVEKIIGRGSGFVAVEIPFTPRAKRVLELAWHQARILNHNYIDTEHLLLGLLKEGDGVGIRVLENLGADLRLLHNLVFRRLGEQMPEPMPVEPPAIPDSTADFTVGPFFWYTSGAVGAIQRARTIADLMGGQSVAPEHLLMALVKEKAICDALQAARVNVVDMRRQVLSSVTPADAYASLLDLLWGSPQSPPVIVFSESTKAMLGDAWRVAVAQEKCVGCEHILLALAGLSEGRVRELLHNAGSDVDSLPNELQAALKTRSEAEASEQEKEDVHREDEQRWAREKDDTEEQPRIIERNTSGSYKMLLLVLLVFGIILMVALFFAVVTTRS